MRERPRLAGEVADAGRPRRRLPRATSRAHALLERLAGLDEAGERAVHARRKVRAARQEKLFSPMNERHHGGRHARVGGELAGRADAHALVALRRGGRAAAAAKLVVAVPCRSWSALPASAKWSSSSTENSGRRPSQDNPAGGAAFAGSSAAQQSTPPRRPRYSVRLGSGPHQLWFFCKAAAGQRPAARGSAGRRSGAPAARARPAACRRRTRTSGPRALRFAEAERFELRRRAERKFAIMALSIICRFRWTPPSRPKQPRPSSPIPFARSPWMRWRRRKSGHPGMPMGMAEIAVALWKRHLRHNPANPRLAEPRPLRALERPRLDAALRLLHLTGYALPIEELKRFRQLGSKTPGHPERGCAPGVETTTGPLGQGLANAVGMALAERLLAARFNKPGHDAGRPLHLCLPGRRLHDGRHLARGLRARRHPGPGQADRLLRRQRHLDRLREGPDQAVVHRRRAASASRPTAGR